MSSRKAVFWLESRYFTDMQLFVRCNCASLLQTMRAQIPLFLKVWPLFGKRFFDILTALIGVNLFSNGRADIFQCQIKFHSSQCESCRLWERVFSEQDISPLNFCEIRFICSYVTRRWLRHHTLRFLSYVDWKVGKDTFLIFKLFRWAFFH